MKIGCSVEDSALGNRDTEEQEERLRRQHEYMQHRHAGSLHQIHSCTSLPASLQQNSELVNPCAFHIPCMIPFQKITVSISNALRNAI